MTDLVDDHGDEPLRPGLGKLRGTGGASQGPKDQRRAELLRRPHRPGGRGEDHLRRGSRSGRRAAAPERPPIRARGQRCQSTPPSGGSQWGSITAPSAVPYRGPRSAARLAGHLLIALHRGTASPSGRPQMQGSGFPFPQGAARLPPGPSPPSNDDPHPPTASAPPASTSSRSLSRQAMLLQSLSGAGKSGQLSRPVGPRSDAGDRLARTSCQASPASPQPSNEGALSSKNTTGRSLEDSSPAPPARAARALARLQRSGAHWLHRDVRRCDSAPPPDRDSAPASDRRSGRHGITRSEVFLRTGRRLRHGWPSSASGPGTISSSRG